MSIEEMISKLDTVTGMLIVASMRDPVVKEAKSMVIAVSIALGEMAQEQEA